MSSYHTYTNSDGSTSYILRWREDGKPMGRVIKGNAKTRELIKNELDSRLSLKEFGLKPIKKMTFPKFCDEFLEGKDPKKVTHTAVKYLRNNITIINLMDFNKENIGKLIEQMKEEGKLADGINRYLHVWKKMGSTMLDKNYLPFNPLARFPEVNGSQGSEIKYLTREEQDEYFKAAWGNYYAFGMIDKFTGGRPGEILTRQVMDFDFSLGKVMFNDKPQWGFTLKDWQRRSTPLMPQLKPYIKNLCKGKKKTDLVIADRYGKTIGEHDFAQDMRRTLKPKVNIPHLKPYVFRHTFSKEMLRHINIYELSRLLGHESVTTTQRFYGHWETTEVDKKIMGKRLYE